MSPRFRRANHFLVYADRIAASVGTGLRLVFSAPPQHGKTEVTLAGLAWICKNFPTKRHAYITYNQQRANRVSKKFRRMLRAAGIRYSGTIDCIELPDGGQVLFTSIDGGITGEPVDGVAIIDDPIKNRKEADSAAKREDVWESYEQAIETRVHDEGSILVLATRWHPEDLSGQLIERGWEYINLPAIAENDNGEDPNGRAPGEALFPEKWPVKALEKKRAAVGEYTWAALYQGRPRPKDGTIFTEPTYFSVVPTVFKAAFGVDLAYTAQKKDSDWSICLEMWRVEQGKDELGNQRDPLFYVMRVDRKRVEAPEFSQLLKRRHASRPHAPMLWRASGVEKGSADFIRRDGVPLVVKAPNGDKVVSSTEVAAAWNAGRVLVPDRSEPAIQNHPMFHDIDEWIDAFIDIVLNFTGSGKEHDDDVDALGNAHHALSGIVELPPPKKPDERKRRSEARNLAF